MLVLALMLALSLEVFAADWVSITGSVVNVRSGPGQQFSVISQVRSGDKLTKTGSEGDWVKVRLPDGRQGYIASWLTADIIVKDTGSSQQVLDITGSVVNLRSGPGTGYPVVGLVRKGETYPYIETLDGWYAIQYRDRVVYVADFLGEVKEKQESSITIIANNVRVRSGPGTQFGVLGHVNDGDKLSVITRIDGWYQVVYGDGVGYVASWLARPEENSSPATIARNTTAESALEYVRVQGTGVRLRSGPGTDYDILAIASPNETLEVIGRSGEWLKVKRSNGQVGYIAGWLTQPLTRTGLDGVVIFLDPGHGGTDPGAIGYSGRFEKTINLMLALELKQALEAKGAKVHLSRNDDSAVGLTDRAVMAENVQADLFVSIHHNAHENRSYHGTSVYYSATNASSMESQRLARNIHKEMLALGLADDGVRERDYRVLKLTNMPAVLVEVGYISNPWEEANLYESSFRTQVVNSMVRGIENYLRGQ